MIGGDKKIARESLSNICLSVINYMEWKPADVGGLFLDGIDYKGILVYYYEAIRLSKKKK